MLSNGGKFYSQMKKITLMALMFLSGIGMTRISYRRLSQRDTVEDAQSGMEVHSLTGELWSGKLCTGVKTQLDTSIIAL